MRDFAQQNKLEGIVEKYIQSSFFLYKKLNISILDFDYDPNTDVVTAEVAPGKDLQAHEGIVHGGIVATYIDTVGGVHAMLHALRNNQVVFTKDLKIEYKKPMLVECGYQIISTHTEKSFIVEIKSDNGLVSRAELIFAFK